MNQTEKLMKLKADIDEAKTRAAILADRKAGLLKNLKDDWDCSSVAVAEKKVKDMDRQIEDLSTKIDKGVAEIEEKYEL